jgi:membrane-bound lytic murein transglycosylase D
MKPLFVKVVSCLLFCIFTMAKPFATPRLPYPDTSNKTRLAANNEPGKRTVVIKEANVVYPALLEEHEKYSLDYVQKFSVNRRAYLERTYVRSKKYFPKAHVILKKYNVPTEFAVLLALESAFNANAVSGAGAVGYWQIMDDVAKEYGLKIAGPTKLVATVKGKAVAKKTAAGKKPAVVDERKNFSKSTYTAARYLKDRMRNLDNNPLLVAASYNWGVGNVWNAMQRTGKRNPTFWDIKNYVPSETKAYVMNFIALNVIFKNYEKFRTNSLCFKPVTRTVAASEDEKDAAMLERSLKE